ncbi:hypothetical protein ACWEV4_02445 [Streptomyces sp. NPDC003860]
MAALTLSVRLTVSEHTADIGELTLAPGDQVGPALATLFRLAGAACDATTQEVSPDGTA